MNPLNMISAAVGFARVVLDPDRLGEVFRFIDGVTTHPAVIGPAVVALRQTEQGARALATRPRLGAVDLRALEKLPDGTLGREFARHMRANGLDPAALPTREAITDGEYVSAHLYETHDIWHVLTGFGADRAGEIGLQAFYSAQFPARVAVGILTIGYLNTLLKEFGDYPARGSAVARGWLLGKRARPVFGVEWKDHWAEPLEEIRRRFDLDVAGVDQLIADWDRTKRRTAGSANPSIGAPAMSAHA